MSGIYGDILLAWPEQQEAFTAFKQNPLINGGWERILGSDVSFIGVLQNTKGAGIKDGNGNLIKSMGFELWTAEPNLNEMFIELPQGIFRILDSNSWIKEGGFFRYTLEKVVGNNGTESDDTSWNLGADSFS